MIKAFVERRKSRASRPPPPCSHQRQTAQAASHEAPIAHVEKTETTNATTEANPLSNTTKTIRKCQICTQQKQAARKYRWKLIIGLMPAFFLASLDLTIVATALPFIASHFNKFNQLNWIVTAFTLTSTAFIPAFGQLADVFGRHSTLQFAVLTMTVGSTLCAAAVNWPMLLLGRALQGISAAGIQNLVIIILADNVSLKEQAKNVSIFQLVNGIGYSVGPIIGGYLTNTNWRYCFVIGIPIALIGNISIWFLLRKHLKPGHPSSEKVSKIQHFLAGMASLDIGGITLFILGSGLIILATAWGGSTFAWDSAAVLVSLIAGALLFVLFFVYEYFLEPGHLLSRLMPRQKPMLPFTLLNQRDVGLVSFIAAATGAAVYSVFYFIGIYFTLVEAYPASRAGVQLLYYVPGLGLGTYVAIYLCNIRPRQTFWPLSIGTIVETAGISVLTYAVAVRNSTLVNVMMVIAGAGTGARFMPGNLHLSGMCSDQIAAVYSILRFSLPFGGTLALTIMGSVFQNKMSTFFGNPALQQATGNGTSANLHSQAALQAINSLPPAEQAAIRHAGAQATKWAFVSILPILGLSVIAGALLGNVWIAPKQTSAVSEEDANTSQSEPGVEVRRSEVLETVYLLALLRGRVKAEKVVKEVVVEPISAETTSTAREDKPETQTARPEV